jgi:hypothetical protein
MFGGGPPPAPPENECKLGEHGRLRCAFADARRLLVTNILAAALFAFTLAVVVSAVFSPSPTEGATGKVYHALLGVLLGLALAVLLVTLWELTPWARREHWRVGFSSGDSGDSGKFLIAAVRSQHWHMVRNLRLELTDLEGETQVIYPRGAERFRVFATRKGDSAGQIDLPGQLGADPMPGIYRFKWIMDATYRKNPIVLARGKHSIP